MKIFHYYTLALKNFNFSSFRSNQLTIWESLPYTLDGNYSFLGIQFAHFNT